MSATSTQEAMRACLKTANDLAALGATRTTDQTDQLKAAIAQAKDLKIQLDALAELDEVNSYAKSSSGMLGLAGSELPPAGQVQVTGMGYAGSTKIGYEQEHVGRRGVRRSFELLDQYGEGIHDNKTYGKTTTDEYRKSFAQYLRRGKDNVSSEGLKILQEGVDTEGGFLVPPDILERIIARDPTPTRIAGRVTQLQTSRDKMTIPRLNYAGNSTDDSDASRYTSGIRVAWTTEIPSSSTASLVTDPIFGQTNIPVYTAMMTLLLTKDMVEDSGFPLVSYVTGLFGQTIDLLKDNMILNGNGQGQPSGILLSPGGTNQPAVIKSGQASTLGTGGATGTTGPNLANLSLSLPEQYDDNAAYVFNKTSTGNTIAQLQDGNGRLLWGAGLQDSGLEPTWKNRTLFGYPTVLSQFMPSVAANAFPIIFGDLSGYYLINRISFSIQVLNEVYATINQIGLVGKVRFGGQIVEPWKLQIMKCST